jgi:fructose 1,6-bisphosphate aldolase/phosphatase
MVSKQYGGNRLNLGHYHSSAGDLSGLPQTTLVTVPRTNTPVIYTYAPLGIDRIVSDPDRQLVVQGTKADIGGVGGHVEAAEELKARIAQYLLENNWYQDGPIFLSMMVTHTGDDVGITMTLPDTIPTSVVDQLLWDAYDEGGNVSAKLGLYGVRQDLIADSFTGNLRGSGPASVRLPLPKHAQNGSISVVVFYADKTEPAAFNNIAKGAFLYPRFNTGLLIASSLMRNGYLFEVVDLDTKAQAIESGVHPLDQAGMDAAMEKFGADVERVITLRGPEDLYDLEALTMGSRGVIGRIYTRRDDGSRGDMAYIVSAEKLHNIKTNRGFVYGGKDDPVALALAQGDFPAPGEMTSPLALNPIVAGDCRGSHNLHIIPVPINSQTAYWSGPIISCMTASVNRHTGRIGAISDQFALGTTWDYIRTEAQRKMVEFRNSVGSQQPGTLPVEELEYQEGFTQRMRRLGAQFELRNVRTGEVVAV